jgi:hypothetical protein
MTGDCLQTREVGWEGATVDSPMDGKCARWTMGAPPLQKEVRAEEQNLALSFPFLASTAPRRPLLPPHRPPSIAVRSPTYCPRSEPGYRPRALSPLA